MDMNELPFDCDDCDYSKLFGDMHECYTVCYHPKVKKCPIFTGYNDKPMYPHPLPEWCPLLKKK